MSKTGFLVKVKAKNREYFYLRKSFWKDNKPQNKNVFSFGNKQKALNSFYEWKNNIENMPSDLREMGFDREDIVNWIDQIEGELNK